MKKLEITGERFGRLTVLYLSPVRNTPKKRYWKVRCICGNEFIATASNIRKAKGGCNDCGNKLIARSKRTHGLTGTRFYRIWSGLKGRCRQNYFQSQYYADKGVICLWDSFEQFRDDMYELYCQHVQAFGEKDTTIDRINGNDNYCKENCRWATIKEQNDNK